MDKELETETNQPPTLTSILGPLPREEMWLSVAHKGPPIGGEPRNWGSDSHQYLQPMGPLWDIDPRASSPRIFHGTFQMAVVKMTAPYRWDLLCVRWGLGGGGKVEFYC